MTKMDELITKLCPNGVEYKKTKEIKKESFWLMPATPHYISEGVPYITSKNIRDGKINFEDCNYISEEDYLSISANRKIEKNDLLVTMIGTIGETAFVEEYTKFYGQNMYLIRLDEEKINRKFYNYYITSPRIKNTLVSRKNTSSQGYIKAGNLEELSVPVPPLEVQCEIVHILDNFTLLTAELKAELKVRRKQYKEYINILLDAKNLHEFKKIKLKELFDFRNGLSKGKEYFGSGTPFVRYTDVYNNRFLHIEDIKERVNCTDKELENLKVKKGDVFFTRTSEIAEEVGYSSVMLDNIENCVFNGFTIKATPKTKLLLPEYCAFCFSTDEFRKFVSTRCAFTTRASLTGKTIGEFELRVPSINKQETIVKQLMSLYKLINDISEGLPAEIEARKKQYEYYRNKLLTFKELENE